MNSVELAYVQGFVQKCGEAGINPDALAKFAARTPPPGPAGGKLMVAAPQAGELDAFRAKARPRAPVATPMPNPTPLPEPPSLVTNLRSKKDELQ